MAKARSPQYPAIGLKEAIDKIAAVYAKDYQNKTSREVVAKHMGYDTLHGKALSVLSAIGKYGLLEGRGDENRVSDLAVAIIAHPPGAPERVQALKEAGSKPDLFAEIDKRFSGGKGSDAAIRSYLLTQKFIPSAADLAIRSYRETKQLVEAESVGYVEDQSIDEAPMTPQAPQGQIKIGMVRERSHAGDTQDGVVVRRAIFTLDEGDVVIEFPGDLSKESVADLADYLDTFMKRARREARPKDEQGPENEAAN